MGFNEGFVWGAATAAYQIEGAAFEHGKGLSVCDTFSHEPNKIYENHNGDIACNHYYMLDEDLDLMKSLGIKSYRFSVSWARVIPDGIGKVNQEGIDFYNRLINGLIERDITPCMTLYHWDLPYSLHLKGGWLNDDAPLWFGEYASVIKDNFGDRVHSFITFNEPQVFVGSGYQIGALGPGYKLSTPELLRIGHNVLKSHGTAVKVLRTDNECSIGFTVASCPCIPATNQTEDIKSAEKLYFSGDADNFVFGDSFWYDPIIFGKYPDWVYEFDSIAKHKITDADMELISQPIDFIGMNIYNGKYVTANDGVIQNKQGIPRTSIGWPITPEALYWGPYFYYERYKKPIIITENGMACHDSISLDGKVHDQNRIDYFKRYLLEMNKAIDDGVEVLGYYAWSLLDNFEWAHGYKERFGLVYVDYQTQQRTIKDSGLWYKQMIESNGKNISD